VENATNNPPGRGTPPLLELRDFSAQGKNHTHLVAQGSSLSLLEGARSLLPRLIHRRDGEDIRILGTHPEELLRNGSLGYAPRTLPAPPSTRLITALELSARLIGQTRSSVSHRLEQLGLSASSKKRLGELSPREQRLSGIAHALVGNPGILALEDPFDQLGDEDSVHLATILEVELDEKYWLLGSRVDNPSCLSLSLRAEELVFHEEGQFKITRRPGELDRESFWVHSLDPLFSLAKSLRSQGAEVIQSPNPHVLLIQGKNPQEIFSAAAALSLAIQEMTPVEGAGFEPSHAKSPG